MDNPATTDMLLAEAEEAVSELYTAAALSMPWLKDEDVGEGQPIMVMPGFLCGDQFTALMKYFLGHRGFSVYGWELNPKVDRYGCEEAMLDLRAHLRSLHERYQKKVSLLSWGVGRAYARDLAGNCPDCVEQVILLGLCARSEKLQVDPIYPNSPGGNYVGDWHTGSAGVRRSSDIPITAIYSETDLTVSWNCNDGRHGCSNENIEVFHGRCGRTFNPGVLNSIIGCLTDRQTARVSPYFAVGEDTASLAQIVNVRANNIGL